MNKIKEIDEICKRYNIENYIINKDGSVDVYGKLILYKNKLKFLPLKFNVVNGDCDFNSNILTSLIGSPVYVNGNFYCSFNNLISLRYSPKEINGDFYCSYNKLKTLEYGPERVYGDYGCSNNKLKNLKGCAKYIKESLDIENNYFIYSFDGLMYNNIRNINCENTILYNVWKLFKDVSKIELFNEMDIIRKTKNGNPAIMIERLNEFLDIIGKPRVEYVEGYINI